MAFARGRQVKAGKGTKSPLGASTQYRQGISSPFVLADSCSLPTQTSRQATSQSSWTPVRCLWRSSASTCPMIPASGSSHETACA